MTRLDEKASGRGLGVDIVAMISALRWRGVNRGRVGEENLDDYFAGVARARYVLRRTFRIFDEEAGHSGLEPLQHQALIQVVAAATAAGSLPVSHIAERLDVTSAFASRLVRDLEAKGLVTREPSDVDRRVILVKSTPAGRSLLIQISENVHRHAAYFQSQLSEADRASTLAVVAFYVGVPLNDTDRKSIESLVESAIDSLDR